MARYILIFYFIQIPFLSESVNLKIRLYSNKESDKMIISVVSSSCYILGLDENENVIDTISRLTSKNRVLNSVYVNLKKGKISVNHLDKNLGVFDKINIASEDKNTIYVMSYNSDERTYQGDIVLYSKDSKYLEIVNSIDIERYVAGVVESEGGHCHLPEYLKAQAVLARTYAIKNINKYISEGYNLTDDVRSQVYGSRCYLRHSKEIIKAVDDTKGLVLFDKKGSLLDAVFHANSGGETVDPIHVWRTEGENYLRTKKDPYSIGHGSYSWDKVVSKKKYLSFFYENYPSLSENNAFLNSMLNIQQEGERKNVITYDGVTIKLSDLRRHLNIRSTFFSVTDLNNGNLYISGKGFGHGIGLSQDGAIKMAQIGVRYRKIIDFYYHDVLLDDYNKIVK